MGRALRPFPLPLRLAGAVLSGLLAVGASGCGGPSRAESGVVELRAWTMWGGEEADAFQAAVDAFNRSHPGIRVRNLPSVDDPKIIRAIVANDPPEIFTVRDPSYLGSLAANGALRPLDDEFRAAGLQEAAFAPGSLSQGRYRSRLYGLLYLMDCIGLIWNRDLFAKAGLDPDRPPATTGELLEYARRLTVRDANGRIQCLGMRPCEPQLVIAAFGGRLMDERTGLPTADSPRNIEALIWYRELIDAQGGSTEVNAFAGGFGQDQGINNPFLQGKVAMMFNGQWNPYWFQHYGPKVRYGAASLPRADRYPELQRPAFLGGNLFCIPANGKHQPEAWEFLRWTQTEPAQVLFASTMHGVPNLLSARKVRSLREGEPWKPYFGLFMDVATSKDAQHFPVTPVSGLYQYELNNAADFVRFGTKTPEQALRDVQRRVLREVGMWQG